MEITKPWCIYRDIFPQGVGKIEDISPDGKSARVRYSEGQVFPLETWDTRYLTTFETLGEAVGEFVKLTKETKWDEYAKIKFPSAFKKAQFV